MMTVREQVAALPIGTKILVLYLDKPTGGLMTAVGIPMDGPYYAIDGSRSVLNRDETIALRIVGTGAVMAVRKSNVIASVLTSREDILKVASGPDLTSILSNIKGVN